MDKKPFAEHLKKLMNERGMTTYAFARDTGLPLSTIRNYAYGTGNPRLDTATKMADTLGVTLDELAQRTAK